MYNIEIGNLTAVKMESYLDFNNTGNWSKITELLDSGGWYARTSDDLVRDLQVYNNDVNDFRQLVNQAIDVLTWFPNMEVNFGHIHTVVISSWNQVIQDPNNNDIVTVRARLNDLTNDPERYHVEITEDNDFFRLNDLLIAVGPIHNVSQIELVLRQNIIQNNTLLMNLLGLIHRRVELFNTINDISNMAREISGTIQNETFRKAKCCPTFWSLVEKYIM
jgi:hypothetical protein